MTDDAPLIETAEAKAPPGGEAAWVVGAGGAKLRAALFTPSAKSGARTRGSIVLSPGRTEPIEKYYEVIGECLDRGFVVLAHDWRGQGLSKRELPDGLKGHAKGFKPFLDDFRILLNAYEPRLPRPWVAVGHSMGGCLTLLAMTKGENRFAGAILSAPMLGIRSPFPMVLSRTLASLALMVGRGSAYTVGGAGKPFDSTFEGSALTHDPARHARAWSLIAAEPKLALGAPTWGWVDFALRATVWLARPDALRNVTVPVVIVSAEDDKLVDNAAQAAAARHLPQGKLISVPGAYHEILMETDPMRNTFMRALDALLGRTAPTPAEPPKPAPAPTPAAPPAAAAAPTPSVEAKPAALAPMPVAAKAAAPKAAAAKSPAPKQAAKAKPVTAKTKPAAKASGAKAAVAKPAAARAAPAKSAPAKAAAKPTAAPKPTAAKAAPKTPAPKTATAKAPTAKVAAKPAAAKSAPAKSAAAKTPTVKKAPAKSANKSAGVSKPAAAKAPPAAKKPAAAKASAAKKPATTTASAAAKKPAGAKAPVAAKKPAAKTPAVKKS